MKAAILKVTLALSALMALAGASAIHSQTLSPSETPQPAAKKIPGAKPKAMKLSGQINSEGTILISDRDLKSWKISNPEAVKDHKNEHVELNVMQDASTGSVAVRSVHTVRQKFSGGNP